MGKYQVVGEIAADPAAREIQQADADELFEAFGLFPLFNGKLDWTAILDSKTSDLPHRGNVGEYDTKVRHVFDAFIVDAGLSNDDRVLVAGDVPDAPCYQLSVLTLRRHIASFVAEPWDTYVMTLDKRWCFMCHLGEQIRWGRRTTGS